MPNLGRPTVLKDGGKQSCASATSRTLHKHGFCVTCQLSSSLGKYWFNSLFDWQPVFSRFNHCGCCMRAYVLYKSKNMVRITGKRLPLAIHALDAIKGCYMPLLSTSRQSYRFWLHCSLNFFTVQAYTAKFLLQASHNYMSLKILWPFKRQLRSQLC